MIRWHSIQRKCMDFKLRLFENKAFSFCMVYIRISLSPSENKRSSRDPGERSKWVPLSLKAKTGQNKCSTAANSSMNHSPMTLRQRLECEQATCQSATGACITRCEQLNR